MERGQIQILIMNMNISINFDFVILQNQPESDAQLLGLILSLPQQKKWAVIMTGGGHFAAAIFNG